MGGIHDGHDRTVSVAQHGEARLAGEAVETVVLKQHDPIAALQHQGWLRSEIPNPGSLEGFKASPTRGSPSKGSSMRLR